MFLDCSRPSADAGMFPFDNRDDQHRFVVNLINLVDFCLFWSESGDDSVKQEDGESSGECWPEEK